MALERKRDKDAGCGQIPGQHIGTVVYDGLPALLMSSHFFLNEEKIKTHMFFMIIFPLDKNDLPSTPPMMETDGSFHVRTYSRSSQ